MPMQWRKRRANRTLGKLAGHVRKTLLAHWMAVEAQTSALLQERTLTQNGGSSGRSEVQPGEGSPTGLLLQKHAHHGLVSELG
jgi:hypothetical protein